MHYAVTRDHMNHCWQYEKIGRSQGGFLTY